MTERKCSQVQNLPVTLQCYRDTMLGCIFKSAPLHHHPAPGLWQDDLALLHEEGGSESGYVRGLFCAMDHEKMDLPVQGIVLGPTASTFCIT